jgi:uncharacterized membrane protein
LAAGGARGDDDAVALAVGVVGAASSVDHVPTGALYSILLVAHVLCAVVGFGAVVLTGLQAGRARRGPSGPGAEGVRRYFRTGTNWAGRAVYGVPVFGFAAIAASGGAWSAADGFVVIGLAMWLVSAALAEVVAWPGERRIQSLLAEGWAESQQAGELQRVCGRVVSAATATAALFVLAVIVMVARP